MLFLLDLRLMLSSFVTVSTGTIAVAACATTTIIMTATHLYSESWKQLPQAIYSLHYKLQVPGLSYN